MKDMGQINTVRKNLLGVIDVLARSGHANAGNSDIENALDLLRKADNHLISYEDAASAPRDD